MGEAIGLKKAGVADKTLALIGDSTFIHSGITGLVDLVYKQGKTTVVIPMSIVGTTNSYTDRDEVERIVAQYTKKIYQMPTNRIGLETGNPRALNMVMLGALSVFLELEEKAWTDCISSRLVPRFLESSLKAFTMGAAEVITMR